MSGICELLYSNFLWHSKEYTFEDVKIWLKEKSVAISEDKTVSFLRWYLFANYKVEDDLKRYCKELKIPHSKSKAVLVELLTDKILQIKCGLQEEKKSLPKKTKQKIPQRVRAAVWEKYVGDRLKGQCYSCKREISFYDFHAGHIISEKHGGEISVENLRPTCTGCNTSCGVQNLNDLRAVLEIVNKA